MKATTTKFRNINITDLREGKILYLFGWKFIYHSKSKDEKNIILIPVFDGSTDNRNKIIFSTDILNHIKLENINTVGGWKSDEYPML